MEDLEDDPVTQEFDVRLSQSLTKRLFLLQYPLRPSHMPYPSENILHSDVCPNGEGVKFDLKVRPRGDNYSSSKGMYFARMVNLGAGDEGGSDLWDQVTLSSGSGGSKEGNIDCYAAAVLQNECLHVTPLKGILQLRPSLAYLDKADVGIRKTESGATSEGDTTESEGEEAKPIMVRFSKPDGAGKSQRKVGHKRSFTETKEAAKPDQSWVRAEFFGADSEEAEEERRLLLAGEEDQRRSFDLSEEQYLNVIFPREDGKSEEGSGGNGAPSGKVSLEQIKKLPLEKQVLEVLNNAHMIQFKQLCSMLGISGSHRGAVLEALMQHAVLVQGCWVVASTVLYPDPPQAPRRAARDYISEHWGNPVVYGQHDIEGGKNTSLSKLYCFNQKRVVPRKDIVGVVRLPNEEVRQLMQTIGVQQFVPQHAWEFRMDSDVDFISRNGSVVVKEEEKWNRRYRELVCEVNLKSPASAKVAMESSPAAGLAKGSDGKEQKDTKSRQRKKSDSSRGAGEGTRESAASEDSGTGAQSSLPLTPQRSGAAADLLPQVIVKKEVKEEVEVKEVDMAFVVDLCQEAVGRGVVGMKEVKDVLLLRQLEAGPGNDAIPQEGVSEALLERGLEICGAVEVGKAAGKRLFARPLNNQYRAAILELFQKYQKIRKNQVIELLESQGKIVHPKEVANVLKELCYGKSGYWRLQGT